MNQEEYISKLKTLHETFEEQKKAIYREYALSNNNVQIGDIVITKFIIIYVETIQIHISSFNNLPECVYSGTQLTKKLLPRAINKQNIVYQRDILEIIKGSNNEK